MLKIRPARNDDCKKCAEFSQINELRTAGGRYISEEYFRECVDDDEMFIVAELDEEVVGYILGEPMKGNIAYLSLLTVSGNHRGKGIGKKLINAFLKRCEKKSLSYISLYAPKFNEKTITFYENCGFTRGKDHMQFEKVLF